MALGDEDLLLWFSASTIMHLDTTSYCQWGHSEWVPTDIKWRVPSFKHFRPSLEIEESVNIYLCNSFPRQIAKLNRNVTEWEAAVYAASN